MKQLHLQLAIDRGTLEEAERLAAHAAGRVDTIEVGTPLLMRYGVEAITRIRKAIEGSDCLLFADTKISDEGRLIARVALEAGADAVSVVDGASRATLGAVHALVAPLGCELWVDLLYHSHPSIRARALAPYATGFVLHRPVEGLPSMLVADLLAIDPPIRLAGGFTIEDVARARALYRQLRAFSSGSDRRDGIIVGRAITRADEWQEVLERFVGLCHGDPYP